MYDEETTLFQNRQDAGHQLAKYLEIRYKMPDLLVIGIPRGGVEVAYYVADRLGAPLSLIVSKKLPYPGQPELGFGAIAEDFSVFVSEDARASLKPQTIANIIDEQTDEVNRRVQLYRNNAPLPEMRNKTVIVVDDGIATGATLVPVVRLCRKRQAQEIVIAVPVAGRRFDQHLYDETDAIEILVQPQPFYAVGQAYESFGDFTDQELLNLLRQLPGQFSA
jgi:putative phosphoribosyl transferase